MEKSYAVVDLHSDTPEYIARHKSTDGSSLKKSSGHVDLPRLRSAGVRVQAMAIFAPRTLLEYMPENMDTEAYFRQMYGVYKEMLKSVEGDAAPVNTYEDISRNAECGLLSLLLTLEDGEIVQNELERLDRLYAAGVRLITLTWNFENCFGFPNSQDEETMRRGLKPFGKEAVWHMQKRGIVVDVSHLSDGGFWDVARLSKKPFVASHSNCRALCGHPRNLTDDMLRTLGDRGGVAGVTFCAKFLREDSKFSAIDDIVRHMQHIKNVAGIQALALGSDFDGIDDSLEFGGSGGLGKLFQACEKAFTPREMDLITHENAERVLCDCLPHA